MRHNTAIYIYIFLPIALVAIAAFTAVRLVGSLFPLSPVEAVTGPILGEPFPVQITKSLVSLDINGDGDARDITPPVSGALLPGDVDVPVVSGYTFTVKSSAPFTSTTTMLISFPIGYDLGTASTIPLVVQIFDPATGSEVWEAATALTLSGNTGSQSGGAYSATFGNLDTSIAAGQNLNVRVLESAGVISPATPGLYRLRVSTSADTTVATSIGHRHGGRMILTPDTPASIVELRFSFYAKNDLIADLDRIILTFDNDFRAAFPSVIQPNAIIIRADRIKNGVTTITPATATPTGAQPNRVVRPDTAPAFDLVGTENDEPQIRITVPDMDPSVTASNFGSQDIAQDALVTVTLGAAAGVRLPTEAATPFQFEEFHDQDFRVRTTDGTGLDTQSGSRFGGTDAAGDQTNIFLNRILELSDASAGKGSIITAVGKGYKNGTQVTVFLDSDGDGVLDKGTESELAKVIVGSDDTFTAQFTVDARFSPITSQNPVQAIDGEGNVACDFFMGSDGICSAANSVATGPTNFDLEGSMLLIPNSGFPGGEFNVVLRDFEPVGAVQVESVLMDGIPVRAPSGKIIGADVGEEVVTLFNGAATFKALVPDTAAPGPQTLSVTVIGPSGPEQAQARFTVEPGGADLLVFKTTPGDTVMVGDLLTYTVTVRNDGPSEARNVQVVDTLPAGVSLIATSGCAEDPAAVPTCSLGTIPPSPPPGEPTPTPGPQPGPGSAQYSITVQVNAGVSGLITNQVTVSSDTDDPNTANNSFSLDTLVVNPPPDCAQSYASPGLVWPPNHKFVPVNILGVTDPEGDPVSISIVSIFQDEPVDAISGGKFGPDGRGIGTDTAEVRAERAGSKKIPGNGRMYHIGFTADDGKGGVCSGEVTVGVPHDRGKGRVPVDDGALFDSTVP